MTRSLSPEDRQRLEQLFDRAVELSPAEQTRFLDEQCPGNAALRAELEWLLAGYRGTDHLGRVPSPLGTRIGSEIGPYRLAEKVGEGGMGEVYAAEQREPVARRVALKVIKSGMDSAAVVARFEAERQALARMSHANVCQVYDGGLTGDGRPFFVMELLSGEPITEFCDRRKLSTRARLEVFLQVCAGVEHAHQKGVLHRDLKPSNLVVVPEGHGAVAKVIDFGVARATTGRLADRTLHTMIGQVVGTLDYMSPEQADPTSADVDTRSDIYSLGVVLYQLVSGLLPFDHLTTARPFSELLRVIREQDPPAPSSRLKRETATQTAIAELHGTTDRALVRHLSGDLDWICMKAMEKEPARRYPSVHALSEDLRRHLANEPVLAGRPGRIYRARKFVRRNRVGVTAAVLVAAVAAAGVFGIVTGQLEAAARTNEVFRLAAKQRLNDLIAEADDLEEMWPAFPSQLRTYDEWIERARALVGELDVHRAKRDELLALARPLAAEERRGEREEHPEYGRLLSLQRELQRREQALARRSGGLEPDAMDLPEPVEGSGGAELMRRAEALFAEGWDDAAMELAYAALDAGLERERFVLEARYQTLEERVAAAGSAEGLERAAAELSELRADHAALEAIVDGQPVWRFPEDQSEARWWHDQLAKLIEGLESLEHARTGLMTEGAVSPEHGWSVATRRARAMELDVAFAPGGEYDARWKAAAQEIADVYPGIRLGVQMGLVPIGRDPASGLWEFWHVQSGEEPLRDDEGKLQLTETTGLVLVLQRGGSFAMGAEPSGPQSALPTLTDAVPVHEVQLSPFFLSKYEMTQGQWLRVTGQNPSRWPPGGQLGGVTLQHPVETVDWHTARRVLGRLGLTLPSEAQWEFGCRGGSAGPFSCPAAELKAHANLADRAYGRAFTRGVTLMEWDDGFQFHAPAGSFEPNALGLHDMHGNLWEWCLDGYEEGFYRDSPPADPVARWRGATHRVLRGGSFMDNARFARSSHRAYDDPQNAADTLGLRPAKGIAPPGTGFARRTDGGG